MRYNFLPSFVRRKGRITKLQEKNLNYLSDYLLADSSILSDNLSFDKIALEMALVMGKIFFLLQKSEMIRCF